MATANSIVRQQPTAEYGDSQQQSTEDSPYEASGYTSCDKIESLSLIIRPWCCSGVRVHLDAHCIAVFVEKFTSITTSFVAYNSLRHTNHIEYFVVER
jgi:hypothetical protein